MNRRIFVKRSLIVSSGILLSHAFISCTSEKIQLQNLLGKSEDLLKKQVKNGDQHFGYYKVSGSQYFHPYFEGKTVFIYCEDQKIVGYTIQIENTKNFEAYKDKLSTKSGVEVKGYKNDFGNGFLWKTDERKLTLEKTQADLNLPEAIFFSESLSNYNLVAL